MHKDSLLQTRVKGELKQAADELFCSMGLTTSDAIRIFITECVAKQCFPFEITPSTKKSSGKDFGIMNPYASPMKRAKERDAWISALVSAPEMMIGDGLIGDTNIEGDRTYNLSDDERDEFQGSDDVNRGFAFDNELFAGLVNDEPLRGNARQGEAAGESEGETGKRDAAGESHDKGERSAAAAGAGAAGAGAAGAVSGECSAAADEGAAAAEAVAAGAVSGERGSARAQHSSPTHHKTRSSRNCASHAKAASHATINTQHKARSPHVLKKPLLDENYHVNKEK